jgi:uncharacterized protein YjiS (DUF1127 family)
MATLATILALLRVWMARRRQRRDLADLDATRLADIGITREARAGECRKWFWER